MKYTHMQRGGDSTDDEKWRRLSNERITSSGRWFTVVATEDHWYSHASHKGTGHVEKMLADTPVAKSRVSHKGTEHVEKILL